MFNNGHKIILFSSGYWHRLQLHAQDCFKKILHTRLMLCNTPVNTVQKDTTYKVHAL